MEIVFNRRAVRQHRDRAAATVARVEPILADAADRLLERIEETTRSFATALDIGGRGVVAPLLRARGIATVSCDLSSRMAALSPTAVVADEEFLPFADASFDLVVASLALHWVNDLPGALLLIRRVLKPNGLFLASVPLLGTLGELRTALAEAEAGLGAATTPRVSPFPALSDCAGLMQRAGFVVPVADITDLRFLYADPLALLRELRWAGEANAVAARDRKTPPRVLFPMALASLPKEEGRVVASLRLGILTAWRPETDTPRFKWQRAGSQAAAQSAEKPAASGAGIAGEQKPKPASQATLGPEHGGFSPLAQGEEQSGAAEPAAHRGTSWRPTRHRP